MKVLRVLVNAFEAVFDGFLVFLVVQYFCPRRSGRHLLESVPFFDKFPSIDSGHRYRHHL